jgi:alpha-tubulin suppressor-like RCC1 family protein
MESAEKLTRVRLTLPLPASPTTGDDHACGATSTGVAYCWGQQSQGAVGNGANQGSTPSPQLVMGSHAFTLLLLGTGDSFGIGSDGKTYAWGNNSNGQQGSNCGVNCLTPGQVSTSQTFTSLAAGGNHACGLNTSGTAYCWGRNNNGQLGVTGGDTSTPQLVSGGLTFTQITAGDNHTCGLTTSGSLYCWGLNASGQLGNGGITSTSTPTLISPPTGSVALTFTSVGAGSLHTCGVTPLGIVYCWGDNSLGQLGTGNNTGSTTPLVVSSP